MTGRFASLAALVLLAVAANPALAQAPEPSTDPETILGLTVRNDRMTVPVAIAGSQPRPFIVDTGAERSVVSHQFATSLGLEPGEAVTLLTMTGRHPAATAKVPGLVIGPLPGSGPFEAPLLDAANLGAHGLLGIDQLQTRMVSIDLDRWQMSVRAAPRRRTRAAPDEIVVSARSRFGQLIVTQAYYGSMRVTMVIDTGSAVTVGNSVLQRRIARSLGRSQPIVLRSVAGGRIEMPYAATSKIRIGEAQIADLPVAFADVPPFARFGLDDRPALLLGMDALRLFSRVDIDFANRQVRFTLPRNVRRDAPLPLLNPSGLR